MAKVRTIYLCRECGAEHAKWVGRCRDCGEWNTLEETVQEPRAGGSGAFGFGRQARAGTLVASNNPPLKIGDIEANAYERIPLPMQEFTRVLGGGVVPGSLVLVGGDPGIGKCVVGETRVLDPETGDYLPITAWGERQRTALAVDDQTLTLKPTAVSAFHEQGVRPIVEVKTKLGRILRCTANHPLLTPQGWAPVSGLQPGSRIATPRNLPYFGNDAMPEAQVKLIAYALSDGSSQSAIGVTNCLPEVGEDLQGIADYFGLNLVRYLKSGTTFQYRFCKNVEARVEARGEVTKALYRIKEQGGISWQAWARAAGVEYDQMRRWRTGKSLPTREALEQLAGAVDIPVESLEPNAREQAEFQTPVARFLESVGVRYKKAADKAIPDCIFRLPPQQMAIFLKTLFTCDGSVYVNKKGQPGISYATISKRLAEDVQHLLLRFGLVATLRTKTGRVKGKPYVSYEVVLLGIEDVKIFLSTIGIVGREEARHQVAKMECPQKPSTQRDTIPTGEAFWEKLRAITQGINFREISRKAGVKILNRRHERPLCRSTVRALADAFPDPYLDSLAYGDVYWDKIASIVPAGEAPVYDLTVPGLENFVANDLIIHNSTLLGQVSGMLAEAMGPVLYLSGEESVYQVKMRAERLGMADKELYLLSETNLDIAIEHMNTLRPKAAIIDSIQTVYLQDLSSSAGSISQVRECAARLMQLAKGENLPIFLVGHVTKEGAIAGPRVLEHIVDTVLYLEGDRFNTFRLLRAQKNRFGSTNEVGVFEMVEGGMVEVPNPSEAFLSDLQAGATGSGVAVTMEGTRPILVEIQSLVTQSAFSQPRRTANGIDMNRLHLLLAVLGKRVGLDLFNQDVFVNVVGGLRINEPAADLAIAAAITSSYREKPIPRDVALVGEIGLGGELRPVSQLDKRLNEAAKLGFTRCIVPKSGRRPIQVDGIEVIAVRTLVEALHLALKEEK